MSLAADQRVGFLVRLYYGFTGARPSSTAYFRTWVQHRDAGWRHEQIANAFAAKYGNVGDEAYVRMAYRNVLGTSNPNPVNLVTWVGRLRAGWSRGRVMLEFTNNTAFRARVAPERHLTQAYFTLLRRLPDPAGRSMWFTFWSRGATTTDTVNDAARLARVRRPLLIGCAGPAVTRAGSGRPRQPPRGGSAPRRRPPGRSGRTSTRRR